MLELTYSFLAGFLGLILAKSVFEPVAERIGRQFLTASVKKILPKVWNSLDLEWPPKSDLGVYDWLVETCIPEKAEEEGISLSQESISAVASYVLDNFDVETFLSKRKAFNLEKP